jgi:hypothetical protein
LTAELDHRAAREINAGRRPEHTTDLVRNTAEGLPHTADRSRVRTVASRLIITTATAGPPIVYGLLAQSLPAIFASGVFALALLMGLWLLRPIRPGR